MLRSKQARMVSPLGLSLANMLNIATPLLEEICCHVLGVHEGSGYEFCRNRVLHSSDTDL